MSLQLILKIVFFFYKLKLEFQYINKCIYVFLNLQQNYIYLYVLYSSIEPHTFLKNHLLWFSCVGSCRKFGWFSRIFSIWQVCQNQKQADEVSKGSFSHRQSVVWFNNGEQCKRVLRDRSRQSTKKSAHKARRRLLLTIF